MAEISYRFKRHIPKTKKYRTTAITIAKDQMRLNRHCREYFWKRPYCELFFDEAEKVIGIKPVHIETPYSLLVINFRNKDGNLTIQCREFLNENRILEYLNIGKRKSFQFPAQWNDKNKMFFVNLKYFKEQINANEA